MKRLSRHEFIKISTNTLLGISGLLGLGGLVRFFSFHPDPETLVEFDLGEVADYPVGSRIIRSDIPAVIQNNAGEIVAHSLICTHLGCMVEESADGFACPCHGSRYDPNGQLVQGPAQKPLQALRVEVIEGHLLKLYTKG